MIYFESGWQTSALTLETLESASNLLNGPDHSILIPAGDGTSDACSQHIYQMRAHSGLSYPGIRGREVFEWPRDSLHPRLGKSQIHAVMSERWLGHLFRVVRDTSLSSFAGSWQIDADYHPRHFGRAQAQKEMESRPNVF